MNGQKTCQACGHELPSEARFCTGCGKRFFQEPQTDARSKEILNLRILYVMAGLLVLAVLFSAVGVAARRPSGLPGHAFYSVAPGARGRGESHPPDRGTGDAGYRRHVSGLVVSGQTLRNL